MVLPLITTSISTPAPARPPPPLDGTLKFDQWRAKCHDVHSLFANPLFVAPQKGDFRLRPGSPAIPFGFQPLDLRQAGVRKYYANPPKE
jgi:hypothetical protein